MSADGDGRFPGALSYDQYIATYLSSGDQDGSDAKDGVAS